MNTYNDKQRKGSLLLLRLIFLLLFFVVVIPNSLRFITIPLFISIGIILIISINSAPPLNKNIITVWILGCLVTLLFLIVGSVNSTSNKHLNQVFFIYIISPLIWLLSSSYLIHKYSIEKIIGKLLVYFFYASLTVPAFFYIFLNYGGVHLTWLIKDVNATVESHNIGATMHVFGPLLFGIAGFFASPSVVKNLRFRILFYILFIFTALISGRSALLLAVFIGVLIGLPVMKIHKAFKIRYVVLLLLSVFPLLYLFSNFNIDVSRILEGTINKILSGGGEVRVDQFNSLIDGIVSTNLLGNGHGVGVEVIRSEEAPWRYELLPLATIYRVGLLGFLVYSIPVIYSLIKFYKLKSSLNNYDVFIFAGLISILIATTTNPYLESFDFQWMIFFPFVYFTNRKPCHDYTR